jgi:hypothetical protein
MTHAVRANPRLIIPEWDLTTPGKTDLISIELQFEQGWTRRWYGQFESRVLHDDWNRRMWLIMDYGEPTKRKRFTGRIQIYESRTDSYDEATRYWYEGKGKPFFEPITGEWFPIAS